MDCSEPEIAHDHKGVGTTKVVERSVGLRSYEDVGLLHHLQWRTLDK